MTSDTETSWKTTIIISTSSQCDEALHILLGQQHRIRRSDSILACSFVFPLSGTAFLLITPEEFQPKLENAELFERIEKFVQVHRNGFLLLQAPVSGKTEWDILSSIQIRFFGCNLRVLPVQSTADVVKAMLIIAKITSKPNIGNLRDQMSLACSHITDHSSVWAILQKIKF